MHSPEPSEFDCTLSPKHEPTEASLQSILDNASIGQAVNSIVCVLYISYNLGCDDE